MKEASGMKSKGAIPISSSDGEIQADARPVIRVLIADDQNLFRDGVAKLLSAQKDMDVVGSAETIGAAIEQLRELRPDIALLGWAANSPQSQKFFAAVQDAKATSRVIMLSGGDGKEDFIEAVRLGCCGILPKQTSTELLIKSIRKVHAGEFWLDRRRLPTSFASSPSGAADPVTGGAPRHSRASAALSQREREIVSLGGAGLQKQRDGREDVHQRADGQEPSAQHLRQTGRFRPPGTGALRHPSQSARSRLEASPRVRTLLSRRDPQCPHLSVKIAPLQSQ